MAEHPEAPHFLDYETRLRLAQDDVATGRATLSDAARNYNIPVSTLHYRCKGVRKSRQEAHSHQQTLSPSQERVLESWCLYLAQSGHPLTQLGLRMKAQRLSGGTLPSTTWYRGFLSRHPALRSGRPQALDPKRARAFNKTTVDDFFAKLGAFVVEHDIPPEHIWNMDEKGIQLNGGRKGDRKKYIVPRNSRHNYKTQSDDIKMVTVIECVSTGGQRVPPFFVFKGKRIQEGWFPPDDEIDVDSDLSAEDEDDNGAESDDEPISRGSLDTDARPRNNADSKASNSPRGTDCEDKENDAGEDSDEEGGVEYEDEEEEDDEPTPTRLGGIYASENGWIDGEVCRLWLHDVWKPAVEAQKELERSTNPDICEKPHLIIWDGHGAHETDQIIDAAIEMGHHLFCLPSHTTHYLQPLDVSCFGVLQHHWKTAVLELGSRGLFVNFNNIVSLYLEVSPRAMTPKNIARGFRRTGISPFNPEIFSRNDYAPSHAYSTQQHLPESYPRPDALIQAYGIRTRQPRRVDFNQDDESAVIFDEERIDTASREELQDQLRSIQAFAQVAHAHSQLAKEEIQTLKAQAAEKSKRRKQKRGAIQTTARGLTGEQYRAYRIDRARQREEAQAEDDRRREVRDERQRQRLEIQAERQSAADKLEYAKAHPPQYQISSTDLITAKGPQLKTFIEDINQLAGCRVLNKTRKVDDLRTSIADYLRIDVSSALDQSSDVSSDKENSAGLLQDTHLQRKRRKVTLIGTLQDRSNQETRPSKASSARRMTRLSRRGAR